MKCDNNCYHTCMSSSYPINAEVYNNIIIMNHRIKVMNNYNTSLAILRMIKIVEKITNKIHKLIIKI